MDSLDREKKWKTHIVVEKGQYLHGGDIIAEVPETHAILHKCMIPPDVEGTVKEVVKDGEYTIDEKRQENVLQNVSISYESRNFHYPVADAEIDEGSGSGPPPSCGDQTERVKKGAYRYRSYSDRARAS